MRAMVDGGYIGVRTTAKREKRKKQDARINGEDSDRMVNDCGTDRTCRHRGNDFTVFDATTRIFVRDLSELGWTCSLTHNQFATTQSHQNRGKTNKMLEADLMAVTVLPVFSTCVDTIRKTKHERVHHCRN
jgi:hypothetical protein